MTTPRRSRPTPAFDALDASEHATVLTQLLASHPELRSEAEQLAVALLGTDTIESVADAVVSALDTIRLEDLATRSGRIRGHGYVNEIDAAHELVSEALEPFLTDLRRRADLGLVDAAGIIATGIAAGMYRSRTPADGTVIAYTGPDTITDFAGQALRDAAGQGVPIPTDAAERYWPEWSWLG